MAGQALDLERPRARPLDLPRVTPRAVGGGLGYVVASVLVAAAVVTGLLVQSLIAAPNVSLIFVLPVVLAGAGFGFRPSLTAAILGALAFDFFFTEPRFSLRIYSPSDIWAAALLLVIAAVVSTVAGEARRQALQSAREAQCANALHGIARLLVEGAGRREAAQATAEALSAMFKAPAAVLIAGGGGVLETAAATEGASLSPADLEAAQWVLEKGAPSHAESYPFDASSFDFWPIRRGGAPAFVLGVRHAEDDDRPPDPAKYVELAGAYLATSLAPADPRR